MSALMFNFFLLILCCLNSKSRKIFIKNLSILLSHLDYWINPSDIFWKTNTVFSWFWIVKYIRRLSLNVRNVSLKWNFNLCLKLQLNLIKSAVIDMIYESFLKNPDEIIWWSVYSEKRIMMNRWGLRRNARGSFDAKRFFRPCLREFETVCIRPHFWMNFFIISPNLPKRGVRRTWENKYDSNDMKFFSWKKPNSIIYWRNILV